ncbi:uncharacterized protein LOC126561448 [Anopheles maculipalpis]|uniref:uncharacterized protein LOC126561448 n=1 Tax=Anopheles maculipalpis TaxID=1496333 RepID=UPI0021596037|nr:uncharacterized protein LOC126561448 [Anopheles maculipalpis]
MATFVTLLLATVMLPMLLHSVGPYAAAEKVWVDRDKVYCEHIDCTSLATYKGEKFCSPCDTRHYCECIETKESLPYMYACPNMAECQTSDKRGPCKKTMSDILCKRIDQAYIEQ